MTVKKERVLSAVRSPLNAKQWCLELACGHEVWWTARGRKPTELECTVCACARMKAEDGTNQRK